MTFISYAQNNEDVLLWRALGHVQDGFYIDAGANDPVEHSVTKAFYDAGWSGINIEPIPRFHQAFLDQRPRDISLAVAAGAHEGELTIYDVPSVNGWASPERAVAELHRAEGHEVLELTVPVQTLAAICARHVHGEIHFLKIDVEGFEGEVLRGMDFARWRPWILVIEATLPNSRVTNHESWEALVTGQRYRFAWFDGLNRYYVAEEHAELMAHFGVQPNVFDAYVSHHLDKAWTAGRQLTAALRDSETHAAEVARAASEAQAQAAALERALHDTQAHAESTGRALDHSQAQLAATARALQEAQAQAAAGAGALREAERALEDTGRALRASEAHGAMLGAQVDEAAQRAAWLREQLDAAFARAEAAASENQAAQARIAQLHDELTAAHQDGHHLTLWARGLEERLLATLHSTSWRITAPLRSVGSVVHALRRPGLARRAVLRVTGNQRLRRLLIPLLLRHPALGQRVSATLTAIKDTAPAVPPAGVPVPDELRDLPVSVRAVLADLQRARNIHEGR